MWPSEWDCGHETGWWYVIKDKAFDLNALKSKRRYEINKGIRNYEVRKINPVDYVDELLEVTKEAYKSWPKKYRPVVDVSRFVADIDQMNRFDVFSAFSREGGDLCGYALLLDNGSFVDFSVLRVKPSTEKFGVNAALIYGILEQYRDRFDGDFYINDGSRTIRHETAFQDYLEKYFGFRKAYCKLNIIYKKEFGALINILYPFRKVISNRGRIGSKICGVLLMEEIKRSFKEGNHR